MVGISSKGFFVGYKKIPKEMGFDYANICGDFI